MNQLDKMEPERVFYYFRKICEIPHGSGNTKKISDYIASFAKEHSIGVQQDDYNNIIMKKPASEGYENEEPYVLQGHMDMVTVKKPEIKKDLDKEGLDLYIEDDFLRAKGTTLGGDDGIAVAYCLALLESDTIKHPELQVILTVNEEVGMEGATGIDLSTITGKRMLNLDSEDEGILLVSCAGGMRVESKIPVVFVSARGIHARIMIEGLKGGHSGQEIDKGRANASIELGRIVSQLVQQKMIGVTTLEGGSKDNAIPVSASCEVIVESDNLDRVEQTIIESEVFLKHKYRKADPDIRVSFTIINKDAVAKVLTEESANRVFEYLTLQPNGVQKMSSQITELVQTSLNMGIVRLNCTDFTGVQCLRSSVQEELNELERKVSFLTENLGGTARSTGAYQPWEYREESTLRTFIENLYEKMFHQKMKVEAIHAGLECGILIGKKPDLDCVSFGPQMYDIHTTEERLSIASTKRTWEFLLAILAGK